MNQQEVRRFVERYFAAFSAHIVESHPAYLTVKLPDEVDKDIGNRPFYWSWVEKMNLPPQPMTLTFCFDEDNMPVDMRHEPMHFGAGRLQQIFHSTRKHGRFICLYEHPQIRNQLLPIRQTSGLTPWLGINVKVSFICDKKRDILLYLGANLHQPVIVHDFYPSIRQLELKPTIPNYLYTLDQRISLEQALQLIENEVQQVIDKQDPDWAVQARDRLTEELAILEAYYDELVEEEHAGKEEDQTTQVAMSTIKETKQIPAIQLTAVSQANGRGSILDFLRANSIPQTPREEINQAEWQSSTPLEEKERRIEELKWQYEPRIEVSMINCGMFYLHSQPIIASTQNGER